MKKLRITFEIVDKNEPVPKGFHSLTQEICSFLKNNIKKIIAFVVAAVIIVVCIDFYVIERKYRLNRKTGNVHKPNCSAVSSDSRFVSYEATAFEVFISGYTFCSECIF